MTFQKRKIMRDGKRQPELRNRGSTRVCSQHFKPEEFYLKEGGK